MHAYMSVGILFQLFATVNHFLKKTFFTTNGIVVNANITFSKAFREHEHLVISCGNLKVRGGAMKNFSSLWYIKRIARKIIKIVL